MSGHCKLVGGADIVDRLNIVWKGGKYFTKYQVGFVFWVGGAFGRDQSISKEIAARSPSCFFTFIWKNISH
jgi:hypothetical protein